MATGQLQKHANDAGDDRGTVGNEAQAHGEHVNQKELGLALYIGRVFSELVAYVGWGVEFAFVVAGIWFAIFAVKSSLDQSQRMLDDMRALIDESPTYWYW